MFGRAVGAEVFAAALGALGTFNGVEILLAAFRAIRGFQCAEALAMAASNLVHRKRKSAFLTTYH
jgi:hypothetical protein